MTEVINPELLHAWLGQTFKSLDTNVLAGANDDDCGVIKTKSGIIVLTTDFVNSSPMVLELGIGGKDVLGRLAVAASLSDLCGSGATPTALLIAVTMPKNSSTSEFKKIISGAKNESEKWNIPIIGGDTKTGKSLAVLGVGVGIAKTEKNLFLKNKAKPGDSVWVSGPLGNCSAATVAISKGLLTAKKQITWAKKSIIYPDIPIAQSSAISKRKIGNGGIDISDGLAKSIQLLSKASNVCIHIDVEKIPVEQNVVEIAKKTNVPAWGFPMVVGGDFAFMVTVNKSHDNYCSKSGLIKIGHVSNGTTNTISLPDGRNVKLASIGHQDNRRLSFADEIEFLIRRLCNVYHC